MKKILVLQQVAHEGLGRLYALFRRAGATEEVIPCYLDGDAVPASLDGYGALVILGGPMSAEDADQDPILSRELALVHEAVAKDFPTLGICLGAQLIAAAAGARIYQGERPEIGWYDVYMSLESSTDPLFAGLPNPLSVFQWHGDGFDLPVGAVHLASSPRFPHQAFRLRDHIYGLQFHLETEEPMVKEWVAANRKELAALGDKVDLDALGNDVTARCEALGQVADTVVNRWLSLVAAYLA